MFLFIILVLDFEHIGVCDKRDGTSAALALK